MGSKFKRLSEYLGNQTEHSVLLTFKQIEQIMGCELPEIAKSYNRWWHHGIRSPDSPARAWKKAGYEVDFVGSESVTFKHRS